MLCKGMRDKNKHNDRYQITNTMKTNKLKQIEAKIDREYKIIRYALLFLNTNMEDSVAKDISKLIGTIDATNLEQEIDEIIKHY